MKKTLLVIATMLLSITASAQLSFGLKGGLNVVNMSLSTDVLNTENRAGWFIGPTVKFNVPIINIGVDASLLYDQRTAEISVEKTGMKGSESVTHKAFNIPINARYGWGLGELGEFFVKGGPQWGFTVGDKTPIEEYKDFEWNNSEFSINLGAGVMLLNHLEIGANYNIVCGRTGEVSTSTVTGALTGGGGARTNAWQVSATYYF